MRDDRNSDDQLSQLSAAEQVILDCIADGKIERVEPDSRTGASRFLATPSRLAEQVNWQ